MRPLDEEDVLDKLQYLVDNGAMGFVVSLLWSFVNPEHERRIKEIIRREYPESYLGAMPVVLSSGYSLDGQAGAIMRKGCNGFIQKPFNLSDLSRAVSEVLRELV